MSFMNSLKEQKLSVLYIEQAYFHRIEIRSLSSIYKLNVRLKKPIILSLHSLPVLRYIIDHSQTLNSILQMENLYEIRVSVPGFGVFNQKYELDRIGNLFLILSEYCQHVAVSVAKIHLQFPGWRAISDEFVLNIFKFVHKCEILEEFSLNLSRVMALASSRTPSEAPSQQEQNTQTYMRTSEEETYYGPRLFTAAQFQQMMKYIGEALPLTVSKIELRLGSWEGVNSAVMDILIEGIRRIYDKLRNLKVLRLDISGWGIGEYDREEEEIQPELVEKLFKTIEEFDGESSELLEIDMRCWPPKYKIGRYKDRFLMLSGAKRKDNPLESYGLWSMTGTNFFGSQIKSKIMNKMKVEIKD